MKIFFYLKKDYCIYYNLNRWRSRTPIARCVHDAMVPDTVRNVAATRLIVENLGFNPPGWERNTITDGASYLGYASRVSVVTLYSLL